MKQAHQVGLIPQIAGAKVCILQSKWHRELSDVMVKKCREVLLSVGAAEPELHLLPGSLEIPLAAQVLSQRKEKPDALIAFGIIIKGDTDHYEVVRDLCMEGLNRVMLDRDIPIIIEILPVRDREHAEARCGDNEFNKGIEAAIAAAEIIAWRKTQKALR